MTKAVKVTQKSLKIRRYEKMIYIDSDYFTEPVLLRSVSAIRADMEHIDTILSSAKAKLSELDAVREELEAMAEVTDNEELTQALSDVVDRADGLRLETEELCERLGDLREELADTLWYMRGGS